jgi:CRISPR/Cas system CMR-associated protein Cmr1 (group 7 of RAMP superfamily)
MKLPEVTYSFSLLTPAMIGGAEGKSASAEMRVASIRGQVRWWHRKADLSPSCNHVWGQTEPSVIASQVSLTLLPSITPDRKEVPILPHKQSGFRDSILPPKKQTLILRRLVGCDKGHWTAAQQAVKLWLLLGGLGLRVNRAAGSVWPDGEWVPTNEDDLKRLLATLGYHHPVRLAAASLATTPQELRRAASDTVDGSPHLFGCINPRKPSPLKMKVIRLGADYRLLLTGLDDAGMDAARRALAGKDLGRAEWHRI